MTIQECWCQAVVRTGHLYRMGHLRPSEVHKQSNVWQGSWAIVTDGHASLLQHLEKCWEEGRERGTGTPPLGSMAESGLTPRRTPSTSTIQRSITCPARPYSSPSQCPFWSLALTELHPITIITAPTQPGLRWSGVFALLQQSSLQPLAHQSLTNAPRCWISN